MIGMLAVVFFIMNRAKDPNTWRWLTDEAAPAEIVRADLGTPDPATASGADETPLQDVASEGNPSAQRRDDGVPGVTGPTDEDPEEIDAALEEYQAISDRKPLLAEEMPSYWRMVKWVERQSADRLGQRSQKNVYFTDFVEVPDKCRGKLFHLRLHVWGTHSYEAPQNSAGIARMYEARGWTNQSNPWIYIVVCPELPTGMPLGPDVREEVSFDGYFLKMMSYEAPRAPGKLEYAPLLVGRMVWHPAQATTETSSQWFWFTIAIGGVVMAAAIWGWSRSKAPAFSIAAAGVPSGSGQVESWLQRAESGAEISDGGTKEAVEGGAESSGGEFHFEPR
jgi:hypothetical protein